MRHDPDIIMIGEIRDEKAAKMAIRAANTGHLVISSIHATSASGSIGRMTELGVDLKQLKDVLVLLSYQKMLYTKNNKRLVLYEMMDEKALQYYFVHNTHHQNYLDINSQMKKLIEVGVLDEQVLEKRNHFN